MNRDRVEGVHIEGETELLMIDLEEFTKIIWQDLQGQSDPAEIRQLLVDLLPKYQEARILTYIPVLIRREAIEILRGRSH